VYASYFCVNLELFRTPSAVAMACGLDRRPGTGRASRNGPLTVRQSEIALLVSRGLTNREIGGRLGISVSTGEVHLENVRRQLQVRSRAQVASWAVRQLDQPELSVEPPTGPNRC
jgi:DNA-binding CsgD family transcriptional regulator